MFTSIQLASLPQRRLYRAPTGVEYNGEITGGCAPMQTSPLDTGPFQRQDAGSREMH